MRDLWIRAAVAPLACAMLTVAGCASTVQPSRAPSAVEVPPTPPAAMLLDEARTASAAGNYDRAAALVERAMRIDPRNPALYLELAGLRLAMGEPQQAENVAMRALTLAPGDGGVAAGAWNLIAGAREQRDDLAGAAAARKQADMAR